MSARIPHRLLPVAWGALALLLCAPATHAAGPADDIQVDVQRLCSLSGNILTHGYVGFTLRLTNRSATRAHRVELATRGNMAVIRQRWDVAPQSTLQVPLLVPLLPGYFWNDTLLVDGVTKEGVSLGLPQVCDYDEKPVVLVSRRLPYDPLNDKINPLPAPTATAGAGAPAAPPGFMGASGASSGSGRDMRAELPRAEMEVDAWPADWRFYSCFDAVALTAEDLAQLTPDARDALTRYAECGGMVLAFGPAAWPAGWEAAPPPESDGIELRPVGFGHWVRLPVTDPGQLTAPQTTWLVTFLKGRIVTQDMFRSKLGAFPVVEKITIPVGGIALCIVLFAVLAGPVNLILLIRGNRRIWMLWTTPLLGILFSATLVLYFMLGEGVRPRARLQALTILNENTRRAATLGADGVYCPLPPSEGIRYSADWEVTPHLSDRYDSAGRLLELTTLQHFRSGWVKSRVPMSFALRGSRHAAERLPVRVVDGEVRAVNGLGAPIRELLVVTADGRAWQGRGIAPGAEAVLAAAAVPDAPRAVPGYSQSLRWLDALPSGPWTAAPGQYVAVLEKSVFLERGLPRADYQETSIVLGISATAGAEGVR